METTFHPNDQHTEIGRLRTVLAGLMDIESHSWDDRHGALTLRGRLTGPSQALYRPIRARMEAEGFTPFLRRTEGQDELVALPGVVEHREQRFLLPVALFILTFTSVLLTGALYESPTRIESFEELLVVLFDIIRSPAAMALGLPFAGTLLGILFTHEMGHYIVGRLRKAPVSPPYFIPLPPGIGIGTMGAVIVQREPMEDRRAILEIGIAGPLAGLLVAVPLLFYGLATSTVGPVPTDVRIVQEGNSLLYIAAKWWVFGQYLPNNGVDVHLNSIAWGAWVGLLITMINLLPVGQLDGGHVAYALLGRKADYVAYGMIALCLVMGIVFNAVFWLIWAGMALFLIGPRHPAPLNDISPISRWHVALGMVGLIVFLLLLTPMPLT